MHREGPGQYLSGCAAHFEADCKSVSGQSDYVPREQPLKLRWSRLLGRMRIQVARKGSARLSIVHEVVRRAADSRHPVLTDNGSPNKE
jgi:hypothetical protein